MTFSTRSFLIAATAVIGLATPLLSPATAADTKLKMVLNWKYQGPQGWFFLAEDRGYFKKAGIDIQMDQGNGSGAPIPLVANGTYDVGFGDINALIQFAATKPAEAPIAQTGTKRGGRSVGVCVFFDIDPPRPCCASYRTSSFD